MAKTKKLKIEPIRPPAPSHDDWDKYDGEIPTEMFAEIVKTTPEDFFDQILIWGGSTSGSGRWARADVRHIGSIEINIEEQHMEYLRSEISENLGKFTQTCDYSMKCAIFKAIYSQINETIAKDLCPADSDNFYNWNVFLYCLDDKFKIPAAPDFTDIIAFEFPTELVEPAIELTPVRLPIAEVARLFGA